MGAVYVCVCVCVCERERMLVCVVVGSSRKYICNRFTEPVYSMEKWDLIPCSNSHINNLHFVEDFCT